MAAFRGLKAMIVDPSTYSRSLLRDVLASLGIRDVLQMESCAEARGTLAMYKRDVVFLSDTAGDAAAFARALRRDTGTRNITVPVFLVADGVKQSALARARDAGLNGVIVKPVSASAVEKKLLALKSPRDWVASQEFIGPDRRGKKERRKARAATRERRGTPKAGSVMKVTPKS
jgi:CheY-like chemotaxis protein